MEASGGLGRVTDLGDTISALAFISLYHSTLAAAPLAF